MLSFKVSGITCGHCVAAITNAVQAVPGASAVTVDRESGLVTVGGNPAAQAVRDAIVEEGYEVEAA